MTDIQIEIASACVFVLSIYLLSKTDKWVGGLASTIRAALNLAALFSMALFFSVLFGLSGNDDCGTDYDQRGAYRDCR